MSEELDRRNPDSWPFMLTRNEVQKILGVNANRVLEVFHRSDFEKIVLGRRLLVTKPALLKWLETQGQANKIGN